MCPRYWIGRGLVLFGVVAVAAGCPQDPSAPADFEVSLTPASLTIVQGASATTAVTITRTNFTEAVTLSLTGAPAGVTGTFNPTAPTGTSSTLTVSVAATVAAGTYNLTVNGAGSPGDRSAALTLTVQPTPDYGLSVNPTTVTIVQGASGTSTVTIARTNFTGAVTLSLSGAPTGVTGAFNPGAPTGTSSTLTISVGVAVTPGTYNLTVNGAGTPGNRSTALTLVVTALPPNFSLSLAPATLTIVQGATGTSTVTITRTNFTGAVTLSLGGAPAGVTGSFNPAAPTGTSSTLTVTVGAAVTPGTYNLTVDGAGAPVGNRSTGLTLTVQPTPDYSLSVAPASLTIIQGATGTSTVTITRTNFADAVTLSLGGGPVGVTGSFDPAAPTGTSSTLTVSVGAAVTPGTYNLTVDGTGTPGNRSTALTLTVEPTPDYTLSVAPPALTIVQGGSDNTTVTITRTNFTGTVTLGINTAPGGVSGSFAPGSTTGTTSTLTISVGAAVPPGTYGVEIAGNGTPGNRTTILSLTVVAGPDYTIALAPTSLTINQGETGNSTVTITRTNFTGAVTLSLGGAPAGVTGGFDPAAPTGTTSTLTVSVGAAVTPGTYNLTVDATATPRDRSEPLTLTVLPAPNYTLSASPNTLTIGQGQSDNTLVSIARINFTGAVTLSLGGAPAGVTGSFDPAAPTGTSSTLTISVGATVTPGTYNLTVDGTGTAGNRSTALTLTVAVPTVSFTAAAQTVSEGVGTATITAQLSSSSSQAVTVPFTVGGTAVDPADYTISASPLTIAAGSTTGTITVTVATDAVAEPDETVIVTLGTPTNATVGATTVHTLTIEAQVPTVSFTQAAQSVNEGVGTTTITALLSSTSSQTVTVPFTVGGTAVDPADYTITASPLTIAAGSTIATITVTVVADAVAEPDETVIVTMGTPTNATPGATTVHSVRIFGQTPTVSFTAAAQSVSEGGTATITAQLSSSSTQAVTVPFTVSGTATRPADYTISASPLTIAAGSTTGTITVTVATDAVAEPDETVIVTMGTPTNATLGATTVHTVTITGGGGGGGNVTVDFSQCPLADRAVWLAYQDGTGPWTVVAGVGDVYTFNIGSAGGGLAYVEVGAGNASSIEVQYMTQAEFTAAPLTICGPQPTTRTITGTAAGLSFTETAQISLGGGTTMASFFNTALTLTGVSDGTHDLVGFKSDPGAPGAATALLRRDVVVNGNGSVGTVDFGGSEAFAAASATITVGGLLGGEIVQHQLFYQVGATCQAAPLVFAGAAATNFTALGIPTAQQRPSDYHRVTISAGGASTDSRIVSESFHTLGDRTVTLGATLPGPTVTSLGGPYKRLQAVYTLPSDYDHSTGFNYEDGSGDKKVNILATAGYLGGAAVTLGLADYSGLAGWDNAWAPAAASTGNTNVVGVGGNLTASVCAENARTKFAAKSGTY